MLGQPEDAGKIAPRLQHLTFPASNTKKDTKGQGEKQRKARTSEAVRARSSLSVLVMGLATTIEKHRLRGDITAAAAVAVTAVNHENSSRCNHTSSSR